MMKPLTSLSRLFHCAAEYARDIYVAWYEPKAMTATQRHMDELKVVSGAAIAGTGAATLNPLEIAGGAEPLVDGLLDMQKAGHKWRAKHPAHAPCGA
jgi:hypothetical protein